MNDTAPLWQRCEQAWHAWLVANGYLVFMASRAVGNTPGTDAPMIQAEGRSLRAPDIQTTKQQVTEYWEVKSRTRSDMDELTGEREHWMELAAFRDYVAVAQASGSRVWVVLFETPTAMADGRWLRIEVRDLRDSGRRGRKLGRDGADVEAWIWPVSSMTVIQGPTVAHTADAPLLPEDGGATPIPDAEYDLVARRGRRRRAVVVGQDPAVPVSLAERVIDQDPVVGLDFLRRRLGVPTLPSYSVLALAPDPERVEDLLALLDYGIRVFVVSQERLESSMDPISLRAFSESRLLEWAQVDQSVGPQLWVVDGQIPVAAEARVEQALDLADASGGINARQYRVVHADTDSDVMIIAGAGTGKTETMAERIVFLLATYGLGSAPEGGSPRHMRADQIALVTFTRDAASEMRGRIARTLMLRQRLSSRCALPVLAWLMQLSGADISTIHSFAKRTVSRSGGAVGVSPGFRVSSMTMTWRALIDEALSPVLEDLFRRFGAQVPAAYEWERHLDKVWQSLANNGVDLLDFAGTGSGPAVAWGDADGDGLSREVVSTTEQVLTRVAEQFRDECLADQAIPTDQLVPLAICGMNASPSSPLGIRYLFVDEFQDTDARQMELLLTISKRLGARLFVVGDPKQGVYRFRGAAGDAFSQFRELWAAEGLPPFHPFLLTRNFRSGRALLDSLHPYFTAWGNRSLLEYSAQDRLLPRAAVVDQSQPTTLTVVRRNSEADQAAGQATAWRESDRDASIGILCRQNWQALQVQKAIRDRGGSCEIRIGGDFFRSPAVRELRVLLEAVVSPYDDGALLELVETRWAAAILGGEAPMGLAVAWGEGPVETLAWSTRLAALNDGDSIARDDLHALRKRVIALAMQLDSMPTLAWVVECNRTFAPATCSRPEADDDVERARYVRCFDQLVTRMDAQFANAPASLESVLFWLRLQVATNFTEDEDADTEATPGRTTALTVHKAKGAEFDCVVVPWTTTPFRRRRYVNRATVLREEGLPRLAWEWKALNGEFTNVASADVELWQRDDAETAQEETRLLYVAMTRAKRQLIVYRPPRLPGSTDSWAGLLAAGGA